MREGARSEMGGVKGGTRKRKQAIEDKNREKRRGEGEAEWRETEELI